MNLASSVVRCEMDCHRVLLLSFVVFFLNNGLIGDTRGPSLACLLFLNFIF